MLSINHLSKKYKNKIILKDITFDIDKGDVISIIGKSGAGKSTLLKCLNRLENYEVGSIYLNGQDIKELPLTILRQKIGLVFQDYNLFENLTIIDNLIIGLIKIKKISKAKAKKQALKLLRKFKLIDKQYNYPDELSGGEKQRIAILRTILMKPDIILLDEPTSALDKESKESVLELINELVQEDMTIIIISHEEYFVNKVSNKIIKIEKGKSKTVEKIM